MTKIMNLLDKKMNSNLLMLKFILYLILFISTMMTICSSSWFNAWMAMEINLVIFIPLMMNFSKKKISNSMMMYFIIQVGASSMMIFFIILNKLQLNFNQSYIYNLLIQSSLLIKLGAPPFHWWMPKIFLNMNWMNCFIFITWQKIAPIFLLISMKNNYMIYLTMLLSVISGAIMGMNQTMLKMIMIYSSINHLGWMLMLMLINKNILLIYFMSYSLINLLICLMMSKKKYLYINELFNNNNQNMYAKIILMTLFLSLSGMPPFLGFLPKFLTLMQMIENNLILESTLFIIMAVISLSFYINPLLSMFIYKKLNFKTNFKNFKNFNIIFLMMLINIMIILIILSFS
uniref:NADH-ubiquinone oxidoreductase chain 2 n=1 Tax=Siobla xizangensis TaxID=2651042 RepID=A0A649WEB9_9HYME|nr:NADH dehydrogenase subunit 2 [Siobla xizangensis]